MNLFHVVLIIPLVEREDYVTVESYLRSWVRCHSVRRNNKSMKELCDGTGNTRVKSLINKYEMVYKALTACSQGFFVTKLRSINFS